MIQPAPLKKGDLIYITAPAKSIDEATIAFAKNFFEAQGFRVELSKHCFGAFNYFSGTDEERAADLQAGIDHPEAKAILCARGGYGCVRIVDQLQWANMLREPKWLIGFSDITVFHHRLFKLGVQSIHGTMPLNFEKNSPEALQTLVEAITGNQKSLTWNANANNRTGKANGKLIGGNLSILYSLIATSDAYFFEGNILFLEDLAEHYYHLDRMFFSLRKSGILDRIIGLIIGGMTDMEDTTIPFGMTSEEIVLQHFQFRKIPIAFDIPSGHIDDNRALIVGAEVELVVENELSILNYVN
ncbi:MAG: LD-carboxypeptidase [Flavobacteriales bacterium]|nr:LD-carboxypeptidase [Crocinitomicaceae bacterium]NBX80133.1 LD-carboxypeptidase [Flavobacteriales bacterium]NCA19946.1 LD-carboxypeptidase [Crocinitomicaceae bacterium]